jgi:hypothetical protein
MQRSSSCLDRVRGSSLCQCFTSGVQGVDFAPNPQNPDSTDPDLVIKPFQWKGSVAFIRDFNRGASHNELGMQAVEIVGDDVDGDFDSVTNEFTTGKLGAVQGRRGGRNRRGDRSGDHKVGDQGGSQGRQAEDARFPALGPLSVPPSASGSSATTGMGQPLSGPCRG